MLHRRNAKCFAVKGELPELTEIRHNFFETRRKGLIALVVCYGNLAARCRICPRRVWRCCDRLYCPASMKPVLFGRARGKSAFGRCQRQLFYLGRATAEPHPSAHDRWPTYVFQVHHLVQRTQCFQFFLAHRKGGDGEERAPVHHQLPGLEKHWTAPPREGKSL